MLCKHSSQRVVATAVQSTITNTRTQTIVSNFLNPLNPNIKIQILICYPYTFSIEVSKENLLKYQLDSSCVIMSLILMTTLFYKAVILHGEIWRWSLLGLKGLSIIFVVKRHDCDFFQGS